MDIPTVWDVTRGNAQLQRLYVTLAGLTPDQGTQYRSMLVAAYQQAILACKLGESISTGQQDPATGWVSNDYVTLQAALQADLNWLTGATQPLQIRGP